MAIIVPVIATWNGTALARAQTDIAASTTALGRMGAVGRGMQSVGRSLTYGITLPIAAISVVSVKAAATFESTMNQIASISGETGKELEASMGAARKEIMRMGTETIYSSQDAAEAFLALQKAGMSTGDVIGGGLSAAMNLAATEGMDLAYASEILAQAMNAYQIPAKQAAKITDILAAGAINSTASVEDLAYGLKYVSSSAAALKVPLDDTVVALAMLNNAGLNASTAGTSLNQMLVSLASPTKQARDMMNQLGISVVDAEGNMKDLPSIVEELDRAMSGMTEPQKQDALRKMFNTRGMRAANILLKEGAEGWATLDANVNKAGGAAQLADARMQGTAGAMERLRGAAETAAIAFGNALAPAVDKVAGALEGLLDWYSKLSPKMQTVIAVGLVVVAVFGFMVMMLGALAASVSALITALGAVAAAIGISVAALLGWVAIIALAVIAVVAAVVLIIANWEKIVAATERAWEKISTTVTQWVGKIRAQFPYLFDFIVGATTAGWNAISGVFKIGLSSLWTGWKFNLGLMWNWLKFIFTVMWGFIKAWFTTISAIFRTGFSTILTLVNTGLGMIKAAFTGDFEKMQEIAKTGLLQIINRFKTLGTDIKNAVGDLSNTLYNAGKQLIQGLINGIKSLIGSVKSIIKDAINFLPGGSTTPVTAGLSQFGVPVPAGRGKANKIGTVVINVNEAGDAVLTARRIKRALETSDITLGREPGIPLARAW